MRGCFSRHVQNAENISITEFDLFDVCNLHLRTDVFDVPRPGKKVPVLMERQSHNPVRRVERLLHPVAVVNVNVDIQYARMVLEKLQDGQNDVVHVAEPRRLGLMS